MENAAATGVLQSDPFSAKYEVNRNEEEFREGQTAVNGTGGDGGLDDVHGKTAAGERGMMGDGEVPRGDAEAGESLHAAGKEDSTHTEEEDILPASGPVIEDIVMADLEEEEVVQGRGGEEGSGDEQHPLPAAVEAGKLHDILPDPYASPDDQPMPQETFSSNLPPTWPREETGGGFQQAQHPDNGAVEVPAAQDVFSVQRENDQPEVVQMEEEVQEGPDQLPGVDGDSMQLLGTGEAFQSSQPFDDMGVNGNKEIVEADLACNTQQDAAESNKIIQSDTTASINANEQQRDLDTFSDGEDIDPIDVVVRANSQENLLGLDADQTVFQKSDIQVKDDSVTALQEHMSQHTPDVDTQDNLIGMSGESQSLDSPSVHESTPDESSANITIGQQENFIVTSTEEESHEIPSPHESIPNQPLADYIIEEQEDLVMTSSDLPSHGSTTVDGFSQGQCSTDQAREKQEDLKGTSMSAESEVLAITGENRTILDQSPAGSTIEKQEDLGGKSAESQAYESTSMPDVIQDQPDPDLSMDAVPTNIQSQPSDILQVTDNGLHEGLNKESVTEEQHEITEPAADADPPLLLQHDIGDGLMHNITVKDPDQEDGSQNNLGESYTHGDDNVAISLTNENNEDGIAVVDAPAVEAISDVKTFVEEEIKETSAQSKEDNVQQMPQEEERQDRDELNSGFEIAESNQEVGAEITDVGSNVLEKEETTGASIETEEEGQVSVIQERLLKDNKQDTELQTTESHHTEPDWEVREEIGSKTFETEKVEEPSAQLKEDIEQDLHGRLLQEDKEEIELTEAGFQINETNGGLLGEIRDGEIGKEVLEEEETKQPSEQLEEFGQEDTQDRLLEEDKQNTELPKAETTLEEKTEIRDSVLQNEVFEVETKEPTKEPEDDHKDLQDILLVEDIRQDKGALEEFQEPISAQLGDNANENVKERFQEEEKQTTELANAEFADPTQEEEVVTTDDQSYSLEEENHASIEHSAKDVHANLLSQGLEENKHKYGMPEGEDTLSEDMARGATESVVEDRPENDKEAISMVSVLDNDADMPVEKTNQSRGSDALVEPQTIESVSTTHEYIANDICHDSAPEDASTCKTSDQHMETSVESAELQHTEDTVFIESDIGTGEFYHRRGAPSATPPNTPEVSTTCMTPPESEVIPSEPPVSGCYTTEGVTHGGDINAALEEGKDQPGDQALSESPMKEADAGKLEETQEDYVKPDVVASTEQAPTQEVTAAAADVCVSDMKDTAKLEAQAEKHGKRASSPKKPKVPTSASSKTPSSKRGIPAAPTPTKPKAPTSSERARKPEEALARKPEVPRAKKQDVPKARKPDIPRAKSPSKPTEQSAKTKPVGKHTSRSGVSIEVTKRTEITKGKPSSKSDSPSGKRDLTKTPLKSSQRAAVPQQKQISTVTPSPGKSTPTRVENKQSESSPGQDKIKMSAMSAVKPKTFTTTTTTTKTTKTEIKSSHSSPRKSDGESPRGKQSPQRGSKIGSLDGSKHVPGGGNVKIYSEKVKFDSVQSRCGSMANATHKPGGGRVKILDKPVTFSKSHVSSRVGSLDNSYHSPGGGNVKILNKSADFSRTAKSRIGSLDNAQHSPGGGNVKILSKSADFSKTAKSKIGSLDNAQHSPGGGRIKIENKKLDFGKKASSKVGSLDNATHKAGGGSLKIRSEKLEFKEKAASKIGSKDNIKHKAGGGQVRIENKKLDFKEKAASKIGSKDNIEHQPGGGQVKIHDEKLEFKTKAQSRVGSMDNATHKPGGGSVQILDEKLEFKTKAQSRVGSMENATHKPGGGSVQIIDEKTDFSERAHSKVGSLDNYQTASHASGEQQTFPASTPPPDDTIH